MKSTNESPGYAAAIRVATPLNIPRVGGRMIGNGKFIRTTVCCDFAGTIKGTGRMLVCDFKQTNEQYRYPTGNPTKLQPHQRSELMNHGAQGAVAGLLIEASKRRRNYWCGWNWLTRTSVPFDLMIDLGPSNVVADLSVVLTPAPAGKDER